MNQTTVSNAIHSAFAKKNTRLLRSTLLVASVCAGISSPRLLAQTPVQAPSSQPVAGLAAVHLGATLTGTGAGELQPGELMLLDNGVPTPTQKWRQVKAGVDPVHVILVIDDVNARLTTIAYEREELKKFFTRKDGTLRVPFSLAVMTDTKLDIQNGFSQNGNAENDALQHYDLGLHEIHRDSQFGGEDRTNICLRALDQLVGYAAKIPGRKVILFVSPGWPLLSGVRVELTTKQQKSIFANVARLQDTMLRAQITLDMVNPFGPTEDLMRSDYYEAFLKGVAKPSDADIADLSLQVLTAHSGGRVQQGTSDIGNMVEKTLSDLDHAYEIDYTPGPAEKPDEYHHLELKVGRPGVAVRMPDEYYAQPAAAH